MKQKIACGYITGKATLSSRRNIISLFQKKKFRVLLLQEQIGQYALNLSVADTAIYYSNGFSWEIRSQTMERIEHPTKKSPLLFIDLVTEDSMDARVLRALTRKDKLSSYYLRKEILNEIRRKHAYKCT